MRPTNVDAELGDETAVQKKLLELFSAERLSALLVIVMGSVVGAYASHGMSPVQWIGAGVSVMGAIGVAVVVHRWPAKAKAPVR
jgi:hypothetical protein